jgi:hypothetical protein
MYTRNIRRVISTDYVVIACCERVGSFLLQLRRGHVGEITQDRYSVNWEGVTKYSGDQVREICAFDKIPDQEKECELVR